MRRLAALLAALSAATVTATAPAAANAHGRVLIVTRGAPPLGAQLLSRALNAWSVPVPGNQTLAAAAQVLRSFPGVELAEPDQRWRVLPRAAHAAGHGFTGADLAVMCTPTPNAPFTTAASLVSAPAPGAPTSEIAVLDSGVDSSGPELSGHVLATINEVGDGTNADTTGHGTAVAGMAAASPGLVQGVAAGAQVLPVKVIDSTGSSTTAWLVAGIDAAVRAGARVINMSIAGPASDSTPADDQLLELAIGEATAAGVTVVAPTGNTGNNELDLPSAYPHVLSVGATDLALNPAPFSTWGIGVDLAAPGQSLSLPAPRALCGSGYGQGEGTSFAAPAAAGAAALLAAARPQITVAQRFELLLQSASLLRPEQQPFLGAGVLNVTAALHAAAPRDDGSEPDDDIFWLRHFPRAHPPLVGPHRRRATFVSYLGPVDEPADVIPLRLVGGDRLVATVHVTSGAAPQLVLWSSRAGDFDVSQGSTRHALAVTAGTTLMFTVHKGGVYYLSVSDVQQSAPLQRYVLTIVRRPRKRHHR